MSDKIEKVENAMPLLLNALSQFQQKMNGAKKDSKNPFHKSTYADLSSVVNAIKEYSEGLNLGFFHTTDGNILTTTMFYSDGTNYAELKSSLPLIKNGTNVMQALGSSITYAKRYTLQGLFGLPSEDDDGSACEGHKLPEKQSPPLAQKKQTFTDNDLEKALPIIQKLKDQYSDMKIVYEKFMDKAIQAYIIPDDMIDKIQNAIMEA